MVIVNPYLPVDKQKNYGISTTNLSSLTTQCNIQLFYTLLYIFGADSEFEVVS